MKLELRLDGDPVAAHEDLTGHVLVVEGGSSRSLTVTARFCERSPSFGAVAFSSVVAVHEGDLATGQAVEFRWRLPAWAPPGVKGARGELFWELEAHSDERGLDTRVTRRFEVVPARAPV